MRTLFPQSRDQKTGNGSLNAMDASAYQKRAAKPTTTTQDKHHANVPRRPPGAANDRMPTANNPKAPPSRHNTGNLNLFVPSSSSPIQLEREEVGNKEDETRNSLDLSHEATDRASHRNLSRGVQCNAHNAQSARGMQYSYLGPSRLDKAVPPEEGLRALPSLPTPVPRKHPSLPHWKWKGSFTSGRRQSSAHSLSFIAPGDKRTGRAYRRKPRACSVARSRRVNCDRE